MRYRGQLIGGVAAEDEDTAQEAVSLIHVEYEEREPFLDIRKGFEQGGPQLTPEGNVFFYDPYYSRRVRKGDIDWAFEHADVIIQGAYRPAAIEQMPTEPQVALVHPQPDGRIVVYSCTQAMYFSMGVLRAAPKPRRPTASSSSAARSAAASAARSTPPRSRWRPSSP